MNKSILLVIDISVAAIAVNNGGFVMTTVAAENDLVGIYFYAMKVSG